MTNLKSKNRVIVIGGSAGSIPVVNAILSGLSKENKIPIIICLHRMKNISSGMDEVFSSKSLLHVIEPHDKEEIKKGGIYLAPSNYHLLIEKNNSFSLSTEELVNYSRPSIDLTLESAAYAYRNNLIGILLTGANKDGAKGMQVIKKMGGITIVQEPTECSVPTMPLAALSLKCIDHKMTTLKIIQYINTL